MVKMKKHPTLGIMVRSDGLILVPASRKFPEHWTAGVEHHTGYKRVCINYKSYTVHRLIAETFVDNPENKAHVDHIDRNKANNDASNLRWVTVSENNYNTSRNLKQGERKCDMSPREYNTMQRRKQRTKCV